MAERKKRFWRKCRIAFRRFRICIWILVLLLLSAILYLNQVGLPDFVKQSLKEKLRARGVDLEFTRMRWRWGQGIVAENVEFGHAGEGSAPTLTAREARLLLDARALSRLRVQVQGLDLRDGQVIWITAPTNAEPRELVVQDIQTQLRLLPGDLWELNNFQARFAGAELRLGGVITNGSELRQWKFMQRDKPTSAGTIERRLQRLADTLDQIHFPAPPELHLDVRGDARDPQSFTVRLNVTTPGAETPWGSIQNAFLALVVHPAATNTLSTAEARLEAERADTSWALARNLVLDLQLLSRAETNYMVDAELKLTAAQLETRAGDISNAVFTAEWTHSITNPIPLRGRGELQIANLSTPWGAASELRLVGHLLESQPDAPSYDESWAWWSLLAPHVLEWEAEVADFRSPELQVPKLACAGTWRSPHLHLSKLDATLYDGTMSATAELDVATRKLEFSGRSDFEAHGISPLLTDKSREWLAQYSWKTPPAISASGSLTLPAWTNRHPDWRGEVRPTVQLDGQFSVGEGAFRGVPFSSAASRFTYSNLVWHLPDLVATRPEGRVELEHRSNELTHDYYFKVRSSIDPQVVRILLNPQFHRGFDLVHFSDPPFIDAEVRGRWYQPELIGVRGHVTTTNVTIRGQPFTSIESELAFTNRFLTLIEPRARRGSEPLSASGVGLDFDAHKIYLTNGYAMTDPVAVARSIGPRIGEHMEPYQFLAPPSVRVNGTIPMRDERDADLHFSVEGGPFEWWKFRVPRISGQVDWVGQRLELNNVRTIFYSGMATGSAAFDFTADRPGADFRFNLGINGADLHLLMSDLASTNNELEGWLDAELYITRANSSDTSTVEGHGQVSLSDGLIWDIPVFGVLSPPLDAIMPGLGSSRAREGSASFRITNGVIHSDNLEIRASAMRLQYTGDLDLKGRVDARVQAELLRDMWGVGRLVSLALWPVSKIFEYRITGTVQDPKSSPVFFIPRIVLLPFHPIRTMKELLPEIPEEEEDRNANPFR